MNIRVNMKRRGDVFGEVALMFNCPRSATVAATQNSVVWVLERDTFRQYVREVHETESSQLELFLNSGGWLRLGGLLGAGAGACMWCMAAGLPPTLSAGCSVCCCCCLQWGLLLREQCMQVGGVQPCTTAGRAACPLRLHMLLELQTRLRCRCCRCYLQCPSWPHCRGTRS